MFLVLDELNKYAPREGWSPIKEVLLDIAERGRQLGMILIGAEQTAREVERRVDRQLARSGSSAGSTRPRPQRTEYGFLPAAARARAAILKPGLDDPAAAADPGAAPDPLPVPVWATRAERGRRRPAAIRSRGSSRAMKIVCTPATGTSAGRSDAATARGVRRRAGEVVAIAREEAVDAVLVAGDVYDIWRRRPRPKRSSSRRWSPWTRPGSRSWPSRATTTARARGSRSCLRRSGARVPDVPAGPRWCLEIPARDGSTVGAGRLRAVRPERRFVGRRCPRAGEWYLTTPRAWGALVPWPGVPTRPGHVLVAHLFTDGAIPGGGEHHVTIGIDYAVSPARCPPPRATSRSATCTAPKGSRGRLPHPLRRLPPPARLRRDRADQVRRHGRGVAGRAGGGREGRAARRPSAAGRAGTLDEVLAPGAPRRLPTGVRPRRTACPGGPGRVREHLPNAVDVPLQYERAEAPEDRGPPRSVPAAPGTSSRPTTGRPRGRHPTPSLLSAFDEVLAEVRRGTTTVRPIRLELAGFTAFGEPRVSTSRPGGVRHRRADRLGQVSCSTP